MHPIMIAPSHAMSRRARGLWVAAAALVAGIALAAVPVATRQGVNFDVSSRTIPLYAKTLAFLHRDVEYRLLSREITRGARGEAARAEAVVRWTHAHITRTPTGWPVIDDHVWHIIVRGHGLEDQMADVFAILASYAGVRAFWRPISPNPIRFVPAFVRLDGRWAMADAARGLLFRDAEGRPLDIARVLSDPAHAEQHRTAFEVDGRSYWAYLDELRPFRVPAVTRAEQQMPWPRVWLQLRRALGQSPSTARRPSSMELAVA
jgi:hypothetical protein